MKKTTTNNSTASSVTLESVLKTVNELTRKQQQLKEQGEWIDYICFTDDLPPGHYNRRGKVLFIAPAEWEEELKSLVSPETNEMLPAPAVFYGSIVVLSKQAAAHFLLVDM